MNCPDPRTERYREEVRRMLWDLLPDDIQRATVTTVADLCNAYAAVEARMVAEAEAYANGGAP